MKATARQTESRWRRLLPWLRGQVSSSNRLVATIQSDSNILRFVNSKDAPRLAELGTSCPDHFLRTKIKPLFVEIPAETLITDNIDTITDAFKTKLSPALESYRREHGHTFWVLERREDGAILGFCGLKRCNQQGGPIGEMEVGWRLREDAWGQGYAKEAAIASIDLAFGRFGAAQVIALTVARNGPSWGLMQRLGMRRREDLDFANDEFDPDAGTIIVYSIDAREWQERAA